MKANLLEKFLIAVAPETAYKRAMYKQAVRGFYSSANIGRSTNGWTTVNSDGEASNRSERDIIRARARDLERNTDILNAEILALERNVINTGIVLQAKVRNSDDTDDDETVNAKIEELWKEWCRAENCDVTGRMDFTEIQTMCVRRKFVDGGILVLKVYEEGKFKLQLIEVDDLDTTVISCGNNRVVSGIEVNTYNKPIAYHIKSYDNEVWNKTIRVPADRVIYIQNITRPSQIREFSHAAASMCRIDDANQLIGSAVMKEKVLSYFSLFIENSLGGNGSFGRTISIDDGRGTSQPVQELEQGTIKRLAPGEKAVSINPSGVSSTMNDILRTTQRLAGSSVGLSYETASRDMSQVNYSSARQGLLEDQRTYQSWQGKIVKLCDAVYLEWLDYMALNGKLPFKSNEYFSNKFKYQKRLWVASGWDWIDPVKEAVANRTALETNQKTLQEIAASKGQDWREVVSQRAREIEYMNKLMPTQAADLDKAKVDTVINNGAVQGEVIDKTAVGESVAADVAAEGETIQSVSLNGSQIDSLMSIVQLVISGEFPFASAMAILTSAFPFTEQDASEILNNGELMKITPINNDEAKEE